MNYSIVKTIMTCDLRQKLAPASLGDAPGKVHRRATGFRLAREEGLDHASILPPHKRTGPTKEGAAALEYRPQDSKQAPLKVCEARDILRRPQDFDIRMAADNAGCGTRGIQQDAVKRFAVPPVFRAGPIATADIG